MGRKKIGNNSRVSLYLSNEAIAMLRKISVISNTTISRIAEIAIRDLFNKEREKEKEKEEEKQDIDADALSVLNNAREINSI